LREIAFPQSPISKLASITVRAVVETAGDGVPGKIAPTDGVARAVHYVTFRLLIPLDLVSASSFLVFFVPDELPTLRATFLLR